MLLGLAIAIAAILAAKSLAVGEAPGGELPQDALDRALEANQPVLVFFHSLNCDPCVQAIEVVDRVMPEYEDVITLVDVNISDTANHPLLRSVGVRTIPAFYFYDRSGEYEVYYGVPVEEDLRSLLDGLESGSLDGV